MYLLQPYDEALRFIIKNGVRKVNRTGVDTIAYCGIQSRYNLAQGFPLITKRELNIKPILAELLWFISGSTNNNVLKSLGCNYWTPWVSESFENSKHYESGSFGPVYGFQLRHFGGRYNKGIENNEGYGYGGFDQLEEMVHLLKSDPNSRRIMFSLWNPKDLNDMRLPPCAYAYQVFVDTVSATLTGHLTQRSCDFPVGVPANLAFYSALTIMLALEIGYMPLELVHEAVDAHIYVNQLDAVEEYLSRPESDSPKLEVTKAKDIYSYTLDDFNLVSYSPFAKIKVPVAV